MNKEDLVLNMLKKNGRKGVTNVDFANANVLRYGSVIMQLRDKGYTIEDESIGGGIHVYVLKGVTSKKIETRKGNEIAFEILAEKYGSEHANEILDLFKENRLTVRKGGRF